jgi:hypothetical protein
MKLQHGYVAVVLFIVACPLANAAMPTPAEMQEAKQWAAAKFDGIVKPLPVDVGLSVLANHDPVQLNSRNGGPMCLGGK